MELIEALDLAIEQWYWIILHKSQNSISVNMLKEKWMEMHPNLNWSNNCAFCEFACEQDSDLNKCENCPANLIEGTRRLFWCQRTMSWDTRPYEFYCELLRLRDKYLRQFTIKVTDDLIKKVNAGFVYFAFDEDDEITDYNYIKIHPEQKFNKNKIEEIIVVGDPPIVSVGKCYKLERTFINLTPEMINKIKNGCKELNLNENR